MMMMMIMMMVVDLGQYGSEMSSHIREVWLKNADHALAIIQNDRWKDELPRSS